MAEQLYQSNRRWLGVGVLFAAVETAVFIAYWPGLFGGFLFDDTVNLTLNAALKHSRPSLDSLWQVMLSSDAGPLKRPLSMASFAVNVWLAGMNGFWFKLTNVLIHLGNGWLVYALARQLLDALAETHAAALSNARRRWVAAALAWMWLAAPLQLTSVLYTVQRMTSLAATFTLLGLILYVAGRRRWLAEPKRWPGALIWMLAGVVGCGTLAALAKENGALIVLYAWLIEWLLFGFRAPTATARRWLVGAHALGVGVPVAGAALWYLGLNLDQLVAGYHNRPFSLEERLLTQPRVLWWYVYWLLVPDIRQMGLFHDDIAISHGLLDPPTTLTAIMEWGLVVGLAIGLRHKAPGLAFGGLFFLAGHAMESTIFPLEMVHEHRNYLPSFGVFWTLAYSLLHPRVGERLLWLRAAIVAGFIGLSLTATWARALSWSDQRRLAVAEATYHPYSPRSNMTAGRVMLEVAERYGRDTQEAKELWQLARVFFTQANRHDRYYHVGRFGLLTLDALEKKPQDRQLLHELQTYLHQGLLSPNAIFTLTQLLKDERHSRWRLPSEVLFGAVDAVLANPRLDQKLRQEMLILAVNTAFARQEYETARRYAKAQVDLDPADPAYRLNLAQALFLSGDRAGAEREMQASARLDREGRLAQARRFIEANMR